MEIIEEKDNTFSISKNVIHDSIYNIYGILYMKKDINFTMEDINVYYTQIYNFLVNDEDDQNGKKLYELYCDQLQDFYERNIIPKIDNSSNFIEDIGKFYNCDQDCIKYLSSLILRYLERYYIKNNGIKSIKDKSREIFEKTIYLKYQDKIIEKTLENLNNYRNYEIEQDTMKPLFTIISIFNNLTNENIIYKSIQKFSNNFFQNYKVELLSNNEYSKYYKEIENAYKREDNMFKNIFSKELYNHYNNFLNQIIVENQIENYNKPNYIFECILRKDYENINRLFLLLNKVNKEEEILLPIILKCFQEEIKDLELTTNSIEKYVIELLELNHQYDILFEKIRNKNENFSKKIGNFINEYKKKLSEYVSKDVNIKNKKYGIIKLLVTHINYYLTRKQSLLDSDFIEKYLKVVLVTQEKDYYLELYSKYLAKRLLFTKYDIEKESEITNHFKKHLGFSATIKIENMIKDIMLHTDEINSKYKVLTLSHWPIYKNTKCLISKEIQDKLNEYKEKYNEKFSQRKVEWNNGISTVTIHLNLNKKYQITMSLIEYSILNLYMRKEFYKIEEIVAELGMKKGECLSYIENLIKYKILISEDEELDDDSKITFNKSFSYKKIHFNIPLPSVEKSKDENKNKQEVNIHRMEIIKATIVRIMKSKKKIKHNNLIIEVTSGISMFQPNVKDIKISIENLIEREYLERSEEGSDIYNYLA